MATEERERKETGGVGGLGVGVGVDIDLKLGQVRDLVHLLNTTLKETGSTVTSIISDLAGTIKSFGPSFKSQAEERGFLEDYDSLVHDLREAASRGEGEARKLLADMGEGEEAKH
jgi:hypothetical protein